MKSRTQLLNGLILLVSGLFVSQLGYTADLATILGRPDGSLEFVKKLVHESESVSPGPFESNTSTQMFSILARRGIETVAHIEAISADGGMDNPTFQQALTQAAAHAPVVFTIVGPLQDEACTWLEAMSEVVFVFPAGRSAGRLNPEDAPHCMAPNILLVAALNAGDEGVADGIEAKLASFSNYGLPVKVAAPGTKIQVTGENGRQSRMSSTSASAAILAGELGVYARLHPEMRGGALVERFLAEKTTYSTELEGKIKGGRALTR